MPVRCWNGDALQVPRDMLLGRNYIAYAEPDEEKVIPTFL